MSRIPQVPEKLMTATQQVTESEYIRLVFESPDRQLELYDGEVREKPGVSLEHTEIAVWLGHLLVRQIDRRRYSVLGESRVRRLPASVFIPDLMVVPAALAQEFRGRPDTLAIFRDPLPLVIEIWSRSTGDYDVNAKIPEYRRRGDLEIWRIHPYEQTITVWRRHADGSYDETIYRKGVIEPVALPSVAIELAELFDNP
jgi:Uma2 family endonuclease